MPKFVRSRARKYGLSSQRKMSQSKAIQLLREKNYVITERNKNCLFLHNSHESLKHFVIKAIVFKILREFDRTVGTEIETNGGIADVIDVDNLIVYEIESNFSKRKLKEKLEQFKIFRDVFFFDTRKFSNNLLEIERQIRQKIV